MLEQVEKVIIITERIIISKIITYLEFLEIRAYTIYNDVSGKGQRGMRSISGGLSRFGDNIRIEIIIDDEEKAEEVAEKVYNKYFSSRYAGIVYLEKIRVVK